MDWTCFYFKNLNLRSPVGLKDQEASVFETAVLEEVQVQVAIAAVGQVGHIALTPAGREARIAQEAAIRAQVPVGMLVS